MPIQSPPQSGKDRKILALVTIVLPWTVCVAAQAPDSMGVGTKVVQVRFTDVSPVIDGIIEEIWQSADSVCDFVQFLPYEKEAPTETTVVYVLQDRDNLYFAFRCWARANRPTACLTGVEDDVKIGIDPFGSKTTAYYFIVYASGIIDDGWLLDDGRCVDGSWDGVWYRAVRLYDDRFEVEVKIPFKSIRYKKGLEEWGVQFAREIAANRETDCWTELTQLEDNMVSKFGTMTGVQPHAAGHYFELYPEGFVRYDQYQEEEGELKPRLSLNVKWDPTPQMTLNATAYPDFAQIESDPFELNLERYPVYLSERRPFFLEGREIFRMSDFGEGKGFFNPLEIFHSRKVGKLIGEEAVPIVGGAKLTHKSRDWNAGLLGAYTDRLEYVDDEGIEATEPRRGFGALRVKHSMFENSDIGLLFSGTRVDEENYNYAFGIDGVYRNGVNQLILQGAVSDRNGKRGWAGAYGYMGMIGSFLTMSGGEVVQDSFDVSDIGFVPWAGQKRLSIVSGPFKTYRKGFFRNLYYGPGIYVAQQAGSEDRSTIGCVTLNPNFRNNWGFSAELLAGRAYEADTNYTYRSGNISTWGSGARYTVNFGGQYSYTYNYRREFLANQGSGWVVYSYTLLPPVRLSLSSNAWFEWDSSDALIAITPRFRPRVDFRINADMNLSVFNELVMETPGRNLGETELLSNRAGLIYSWNFLPKSWFYIAVNDYREQSEGGGLELENRIAAVKAKYLIYF